MPSLSLGKSGVYAIRALLALLVLVASLTWLLGTESALRWGARQAERLSDGRLELRAVHGSLYGPLRIEALSFRTDEKRFEAKEASLDWSPRALLGRHIQVERMSAQELRIIEIKPSAEPVKLPQTLRFPLSLSAPAVTLGRVVFKAAGTEHVLSGIDLGVDKRGSSYQLRLRGVASEWGKGQGELVLGDTRPFEVSAQATLQHAGDWAYRADAEVSGNLVQVLLKGKARVLGGQAEIDATLAPFAANPFAAAHIKASGMNPALLRKDLPKADLGAVISVARLGTDGVAGSIVVRNGQPGPWDQARLPLREMAARFSGTPDRLDLRAIHLDLAGAGDFEGSGQVRGQHLQLELNTTRFDPRGVHGKMRAMRLAGAIRLMAERDSQELSADLRYQRFQLHLDARHRDGIVEVRKAALQSGADTLTLHGTLALEGLKPFQLAGALQGFNPADFGDYPAARINASFSGDGRLAGEPRATLEFAVADSHFRGQPLSGHGNLSVSAKRIWNSAVLLQLARNRLELKGALGNPGDRLAFSIEAGKLAMFDPELGGQVHATGSLEGRFSALSGNFEAQASDLSWRKHYRVGSLQASGRLDKGVNGPLTLEATLQGLTTPQLRLDRAGLNAQGTRAAHTLRFLAKNQDFDVASRFVGGWRDGIGWSGQLTDLANSGSHAFLLKSPAKLEIARQHFLLNDARVEFAGASVVLHELAYDAGKVASRGAFQNLPLAYLQGFTQHSADLKSDLALGGNWQFAARDKVNGHISIWRERGDITLPTVPQTTLGLSRIAANIDAVDNLLRGSLEAAGTRLGSLKADAQTMLSTRNGIWGIAGDAPLRANAELSIESLAWIGPLLDNSGALTVDGALKGAVRAGGSFAQPMLAGTLVGERFAVALPEQGLRLTQGRFKAELQDQVLHLKELALRGGDGMLTAQGQLALAGEPPVMQLALKADRLEVLSRPDRHLILSGTGDASMAGKKVRIAASLKADQGLIELPRGDTPTPSADVVVLGRTKVAEKKKLPYALSFDLDLDMGEHFFVKGKGLDAQLGGALKLTSEAGGALSARGSIRVVKGAYAAYGQRLVIERGTLGFQGPLDDPGLNIVALRKNQPVEAGVAVSGTAQSPRVKLVSTPDVPDNEKLSWLVLGHGLEGTSGQEFSALQAAAGTLLGAGESVTLQQRIAYAAGLEEVGLKGAGGLENTVLALGKRLSSRAYLSYEQGLSGAGSLVKINYTLSKRVSLRAQAGTTPAVDLFYTFSFD